MAFLFLWVLFAAIVGAMATGKTIGFWGAFFISLLLSPLVGAIFALASKSNEQDEREKQTALLQRQTVELMKGNTQKKDDDLTAQLQRLSDLKSKGELTNGEYEAAKKKLLA